MTLLIAMGLATGIVLGTVGRVQTQDPKETRAREKIVGLPCEGCEAVFEGLPDVLTPSARIAPKDEPGQAMRIEGTVRDRKGQPRRDVIVYAYHTNVRGVYPKDERLRGQAAFRHGRLRGWVKTDEQGRYRFDTIRPGGYPDGTTAAHVHMHVIEIGSCTYYIDSIKFKDDPRLSEEVRKRPVRGRGGSGLVMPKRDEAGVWIVRRDIVLGERIPGHPQNAAKDDAADGAAPPP